MRDLALLLMRLGFGLSMIFAHGYPKLINLLDGNSDFLGNPIGVGGTITVILAILVEVVFAALVVIGFKTRIASIPLILIMALAFFIIHATDPFKVKELALMYLIGFASIALLGPGKYSIDRN